MELVKGMPITQYCDAKQLKLRERLELFLSVCQAIQHAHQKGIIHRDIKPTNVLVAEYDDQAIAKIIDFGVAKAAGARLAASTTFTELGQVVGTLEYMSPEQATLNPIDIDTRSDIYSLGVLLYELLTGTTPFEKQALEKTAFDEMLRIIREDEPPRPSTRLTRRDSLPGVAANRSTEPTRLSRAIRGELDWIVMKALEKDRERRYGSAIGLARDIERHLNDDPVLARAPSAWYRLRKLATRHRVIFVAAAGAVLVMLVALWRFFMSNVLIRREQANTKEAKERACGAQELAEGHAEEVRDGLERLRAANALLDRGRWYATEGRFDDAHQAFSRAIAMHPAHVSLLVARGDLYTRLGLWDLAAGDYAQEMEMREPDSTVRWYQHALLCRANGDDDGCRRIVQAMKKRFAGTIDSRFAEEFARASVLVSCPADELYPLIELCRAATPTRARTAPYVLGAVLYRAGEYDEAVRWLKQAQAAQPAWSISKLSYPVLAMALFRLGRKAEAQQALKEAVRIVDGWIDERYAGRGESWAIRPGGDANWPVCWWDFLECQLLYGEAKRLVDGTAPPDDARLHVLRARALAGLDWVEQAAAEFSAAPCFARTTRRSASRCTETSASAMFEAAAGLMLARSSRSQPIFVPTIRRCGASGPRLNLLLEKTQRIARRARPCSSASPRPETRASRRMCCWRAFWARTHCHRWSKCCRLGRWLRGCGTGGPACMRSALPRGTVSGGRQMLRDGGQDLSAASLGVVLYGHGPSSPGRQRSRRPRTRPSEALGRGGEPSERRRPEGHRAGVGRLARAGRMHRAFARNRGTAKEPKSEQVS